MGTHPKVFSKSFHMNTSVVYSFQNFCVIVPLAKVASATQGLTHSCL